MNKLNFLFIGFLVIILCNCNSKNEINNKKTTITISQWGKENYLIYLPLYVAIEKKFFKEEGLDINLKYSGNDDQVFATVIKGEAEFGVGDPVFTAIAREQGFKGKVIATIVNGVSIWGVTNNPKIKPIGKLEDLKGLRIGTFPAPSTNFTLMNKTIKENHLILQNTTIVQAPIGNQIALLENNSADIAMELEPSASLAISKGYRLVFSSPKFHGEFAFTGITTSEEFIESHPEITQKFVSALERAVRFCHNNKNELNEIAKKLFPNITGNVIEMAINRMINEKVLPEHIITTKEAWGKAIEVRKIVGDLKNTTNAMKSVENKFALKSQKDK